MTIELLKNTNNMDLIKSATDRKELITYNNYCLTGFMKYLVDNGCKALFCAGVDSDNRIQIVMVDGMSLDQVKELIQQMGKEFERLKTSK